MALRQAKLTTERYITCAAGAIDTDKPHQVVSGIVRY